MVHFITGVLLAYPAEFVLTVDAGHVVAAEVFFDGDVTDWTETDVVVDFSLGIFLACKTCMLEPFAVETH